MIQVFLGLCQQSGKDLFASQISCSFIHKKCMLKLKNVYQSSCFTSVKDNKHKVAQRKS